METDRIMPIQREAPSIEGNLKSPSQDAEKFVNTDLL